MNYVYKTVKVIILIYIALFVISNFQEVDITLIPRYVKYTMPLFLPIMVSLFVGGLVTAIGGSVERMRLKNDLKTAVKDLKRTEEENNRLRASVVVNDNNLKKDN